MEIFNIVSGICSIIGLGVSLFVASKVTKNTNSYNNNKGNILSGDGKQTVAEDHSAVADNHSVVHITDNRNAKIYGQIDEYPILTENTYTITVMQHEKYRQGVCDNTCELMILNPLNNFCFSFNFSEVDSRPEENRWIGYSIKSLPMNDWRSFVKKSCVLSFNYKSTETIGEFWIEITNFQLGKKIYKQKMNLSKTSNTFSLNLGQFKTTIIDWKSVDEICFVFFPENCVGSVGVLYISDFLVCKE